MTAFTILDLTNLQLLGVPTAPTAAAGTSTTQIATAAFVANAVPTANIQTISGASGTVTGGVVIATNGAGSTFTLPASPTTGQQIWIKAGVTLTGAVISASSNVVPLNSTTAGTTIIAAAGSAAYLIFDGTNWQVINGK